MQDLKAAFMDEERLHLLKDRYRNALAAGRYTSRRYGGFLRRLNSYWIGRALRVAVSSLPRGSSVLDVPCGTAQAYRWLRRLDLRYLGADASIEMMSQARRRFGLVWSHSALVQAEFEALPYADDSVDVICCMRFLVHLNLFHRRRVLEALARISRSFVIASYANPYTYKNFSRIIRGRGSIVVPYPKQVTAREIHEDALSAGLRVQRIIPVLPVLSESWIVVMGKPGRTG